MFEGKLNLLRPFLFLSVLLLCVKVKSATFVVTNTNDSGAGSLRQAITDANTNPGNDKIIFNLGAGGPFTINLLSALPSLTDNSGVEIDGWDNSGNNGTPNTMQIFSINPTTPLNPVYKIILGNSGNIPVGLTISSSNNLIKGLVFPDFGDGTPSNNDIVISITANSNTVIGCYIGMNETGVIPGPRSSRGIKITGANNLIGDGTPAGVNLISGMRGFGMKIHVTTAAATANVIKGNVIGLQSDGLSAVTNTSSGISIDPGANTCTIGGINSGDGNLVSGNYNYGLSVWSNSNTIQGNYVGCAADGMSGITITPAQSTGISIGSFFNVIGGSSVNARNIVSGNGNQGIGISIGDVKVIGNYVGVNKLGTAAINTLQIQGVTVNGASTSTIGGTGAGEGNLISGNATMGVFIVSQTGTTGVSVLQNTIGPAAGGTNTLSFGSQQYGVYLASSINCTIGGNLGASSRNIVSGNTLGGFYILSSPCTGNIIKGNYIGISADGINRITGVSQTYGIFMSLGAASNTIGGLNTGDGNVISGNTVYGIGFNSNAGTGNIIYGNIIGPQANGVSNVAGSSQAYGIYLNGGGTVIGDGSVAGRNIISANNSFSSYGIFISGNSASANLIRGNYIGPGSTGAQIVGSSQVTGIRIENSAATNTVGGYLGNFGTNPQGNLIAFNNGHGLNVIQTNTRFNLISRNLIYSNGSAFLPINLNYGVNQGNDGKAAPAISTVSTSIITGSNAATAGVGDTVEVFKNTTGNCRDLMTYLGSTVATTAGNWTLTGITVNPGESVVAVARTVSNNNTSQASICTSPLPIELLYFKAACINGNVELDWATASELNTHCFLISKTKDGANYNLFDSVPAAGKSNVVKKYVIHDWESFGKNYVYRLEQRDVNGDVKYFYTSPEKLCGKGKLTPVLYPSPADEKITVSFQGLVDEPVNLYIIDVSGKEIYLKDNVKIDGSFTIGLESFAPGVYALRVTGRGKTETIKFVKH